MDGRVPSRAGVWNGSAEHGSGLGGKAPVRHEPNAAAPVRISQRLFDRHVRGVIGWPVQVQTIPIRSTKLIVFATMITISVWTHRPRAVLLSKGTDPRADRRGVASSYGRRYNGVNIPKKIQGYRSNCRGAQAEAMISTRAVAEPQPFRSYASAGPERTLPHKRQPPVLRPVTFCSPFIRSKFRRARNDGIHWNLLSCPILLALG